MAELFSRQFLDDLKARCDAVSVIGSRVQLERSGNNFKGRCPFHNEKTPSFYVYQDTGTYHCFGCNAHGTVIDFVMETENRQFRDAVESLAQRAGVPLPKTSPQNERRARARQSREEKLIGTLQKTQNYYVKSLTGNRRAQEYLRNRGLNNEILKRYGIGYAPSSGLSEALPDADQKLLIEAGVLAEGQGDTVYQRFRDRIMFPIRDVRGRTLGFGGRVLDPAREPKYINSPQTPIFHKRRTLYGLHEARQQQRLERIVLVEGYMDVVALSQFGIYYAAASLGTSVTPEHFDLLFRNTPEVVCCFDGDDAGRRAAWRALDVALGSMREGRRTRFLFLEEGEDPDSIVRAEGPEKFQVRLESAMPTSDYFISELVRGKDMNSVEAPTEVVEEARPIMRNVSYDVHKRVLVQKLSEVTGLDQDFLLREFGGSVADGAPEPRQHSVSELHRGDVNISKLLIQRPDLVLLLSKDTIKAASKHGTRALCCDMINRIYEHEIKTTHELIGSYVTSDYKDVVHSLANRTGQVPVVATAGGLEDSVLALFTRLDREEREDQMEKNNTMESLARTYGGQAGSESA